MSLNSTVCIPFRGGINKNTVSPIMFLFADTYFQAILDSDISEKLQLIKWMFPSSLNSLTVSTNKKITRECIEKKK